MMYSDIANDTWPLQDAKARFSELVNQCLDSGTQIVSRHGKPTVAIVPIEEYQRLTGHAQSLGAFFAAAPQTELDLSRVQEGPRDIEL
jgi:prevent-host-death family protein